jgi:hypothetical protein
LAGGTDAAGHELFAAAAAAALELHDLLRSWHNRPLYSAGKFATHPDLSHHLLDRSVERQQPRRLFDLLGPHEARIAVTLCKVRCHPVSPLPARQSLPA